MAQSLPVPSKEWYLGKGKLQELKAMRADTNYDTIIVDDELTSLQQRNLENFLEVKVIDRVTLILDIFARHAHTKEGKLQVELAQYQYLLPRLAGRWQHLERLGGGIGTRGPGESQLETDRRIIRRRIERLKEGVEDVRKHRHLYYHKRQKVMLPTVALVGYTNAGKTALFNALSHSEVLSEDKLFATLDPTTRKIYLPDYGRVLLTDTVGFIRKLPPTIVDAFNATLEELQEASIVVHVVDISLTKAAEQYDIVEEVLRSLGVIHKPSITVLNKADLIVDTPMGVEGGIVSDFSQKGWRSMVVTSATKGWGLEELKEAMVHLLNEIGARSNELLPTKHSDSSTS